MLLCDVVLDVPQTGFTILGLSPLLLGLIILSSLLLLLFVLTKSKQISGSPPLVSGFLPWVGCGISFAKHPLGFATQLFKEKGDVFTIQAFGKRMTFLVGPTHPCMIKYVRKTNK
eukprot:TRINITY_DN5940_c0_g1_i2.p1 TRINITY_DN5940_c0_g1~~TRINITY_DN5940_c0_g1_i2.p1  ORF type:complete len:115 (+),score=9.99 TRINITY_DN5940_c0_g1_i2:98-442(+)